MIQALRMEICALMEIADNLHYVNKYYKNAVLSLEEKRLIAEVNKAVEDYRIYRRKVTV